MRWIKPHDLYQCRNLLLQSPFRGSRGLDKPCSFINKRRLGVDTFVSVASKARGHSHQKTKIIFFVGCLQQKTAYESCRRAEILLCLAVVPLNITLESAIANLDSFKSCPRTVCAAKRERKRSKEQQDYESSRAKKRGEKHGGREE